MLGGAGAIKICPAKGWQFQNFYMGGFMGSYLVGGRGQEFHLRYTSHMFEKAFDVYFEDLGVGTILVCI